MQIFDLDTKVLVARPFGISCIDLESVTNLTDFLVPTDCNVGWGNLSSLTKYDKVLMYDRNKRYFFYNNLPHIEVIGNTCNLLEIAGVESFGGSGFHIDLKAGKTCSSKTECLYGYENSDIIYSCTAQELYDMLKADFYRKGNSHKTIYGYTLGLDLSCQSNELDIRKVGLDYNLCKDLGSISKLFVSVDIDYRMVLLTKNNEYNMF